MFRNTDRHNTRLDKLRHLRNDSLTRLQDNLVVTILKLCHLPIKNQTEWNGASLGDRKDRSSSVQSIFHAGNRGGCRRRYASKCKPVQAGAQMWERTQGSQRS